MSLLVITKVLVEETEVHKLFVIFEDLVGEKQSLDRDEFQQALGNLRVRILL